MFETTGGSIALLFMLVATFSSIYLIGILPWRRRKTKMASLSKQAKFASIMLFIYSGMAFVGTAIKLPRQGELSLMSVLVIVVAADYSATAILIIKRSMYALISLMGAMALILFSYVYMGIIRYSDNVTSIVDHIPALIGRLIAILLLYSPALRGIFAIRDLEREAKATSDSIDDMT